MRKHTNGGYANVLDELWKVCEEFHADMVLMYSHISCKTMAGLQGLFDDQARERGIRFYLGGTRSDGPQNGLQAPYERICEPLYAHSHA